MGNTSFLLLLLFKSEIFWYFFFFVCVCRWRKDDSFAAKTGVHASQVGCSCCRPCCCCTALKKHTILEETFLDFYALTCTYGTFLYT